jgi:hypothetical protein
MCDNITGYLCGILSGLLNMTTQKGVGVRHSFEIPTFQGMIGVWKTPLQPKIGRNDDQL